MRAIRSLYDWTLKQADKRYAEWILFAVAFVESSFFPIPPDIMLLPMCIAQRAKAMRFALICTVGSVLGALLGYAIGAFLFNTVGQWVIQTYHLQSAFDKFQEGFDRYGYAIIIIKGFLFIIPFKLVTIAAGVAHYALVPFILACFATRAGRFYLVAWLIKRHGETIRPFIEKHLGLLALGLLVLVALGFWLVLH